MFLRLFANFQPTNHYVDLKDLGGSQPKHNARMQIQPQT